METFAERLQQALDKAGFTPAELARRAFISRASISLYLSGDTKQPTHAVLVRIAKALSVDPDWLVGNKKVQIRHEIHLPDKTEINRLFDMLLEDQQAHIVSEMSELVQMNRQQLEELQKKFK